MALVNKGTIRRPLEGARNHPIFAIYAALLVAAAAVSLAMIVAAPAAPLLTSAPSRSSATAVDGWEAGISAPATTRLERVQDGYFPGVIAANPPTDAVDGWVLAVFGGAGTGEARDGWESSLIR
jgi:hypothetical protein